ncbi:threonine synthase-like protein [Kipferlia bialata]|uniref:Threonine synthase-like protein n=1 Tax=Kipferlia bialata TaxID=797122 RepID=A0A9K3CZ65_9EUKA|nr:threonine synthase-like protein [Kipferlia bialata]|eukprot:g7710.t1
MNHVTGLVCCQCGETFPIEKEFRYTCTKCGHNLNVTYDYAGIRSDVDKGLKGKGVFRYMPFLPLSAPASLPLLVGETPLMKVDRLASNVGVKTLYLKDEGRNPTGSLKDRASALIVAYAKEQGYPIVTTASTGNAGAALAGIAASVGMNTVILVPKTAPVAKIAQLQTFGATVILVDGTYDMAFELCTRAAEKYGWYSRSTGINSFTSEGKKTVSLEIAEQTGEYKGTAWSVPDWVCVSVGDGNIVTGVYKGFRDLHAAGLIDRMPQILGVNSTRSNYCYKAWAEKRDPATMDPVVADTRADSIAAGLPADRVNAVKAIQATNGAFVQVEDAAILAEIPTIGSLTGVFAEPAASCAVAGLRQAVLDGTIPADAEVCAIITGTGLKDVAAAQSQCSAAPVVAVGDGDVAKVAEIAKA